MPTVNPEATANHPLPRCQYCDVYESDAGVTLATGYPKCLRCTRCSWCGNRPWTVDPDGTYTLMRCERCKCSVCGKGDPGNHIAPDGSAFRGCLACFLKKYNIPMCRDCKQRPATILLRGHTKPGVCNECVRSDRRSGMRKTHYCYFCKEKATHASKWVLCKKHAEMRTCAAEGCAPGTQCRRCAQRAEEDRRIANLRSGLAGDNPYSHEQNESGQCYEDCRACESIEAAPIEFRNEGLTFHPAYAGPNPPLKTIDRRLNRSRRYLSVEIEVAGLNNPRRKDLLVAVMKKWGGQIVHDGSLPSGGFEINTAPAAGDYFVRQISEICTALRDAGGFTTPACGLHVHADARDYTYEDLRRLFLYYAKVEPAFVQMQPFERSINGYCRPVGQQLANAVRNVGPEAYLKANNNTKPIKNAIFRGIYEGETFGSNVRPPRNNHYASEYGTPHYDGLNAHSWLYRGTIENRFHNGTVVARKIIDWAMLFGAFLDKAYTVTAEQIEAAKPKEELLRIAPNDRVRAYIEARIHSNRAQYAQKGIAV